MRPAKGPFVHFGSRARMALAPPGLGYVGRLCVNTVGGPSGPNYNRGIRLSVTKGRRATFAVDAIGNVGRAGLKPLLQVPRLSS